MGNTKDQVVQPQSSAGLGWCLQGVQHVGVTVNDMPKSIEFYTEVLGGKISVAGYGFVGDVLQNTLFQKEQIDAIQRNIDLRREREKALKLGIPQIRDNTEEALDVCFISFGNTCIELLHFRDAKKDQRALNPFPPVPSGVAWVNAGHISFHVKDDMDLNKFSKMLEEECRRRGIEVQCNRVIDVTSEQQRREAALRYCANKFWKDENPDYVVEGYSENDFGDFLGWSLFYCKGPSGEQLEFNQVTRKVKEHFQRARSEYNSSNGTTFEPSRSRPVSELRPKS
jgi:catechol 2,3-dioxygenase-like lactoylglutathione lyase family enzyme